MLCNTALFPLVFVSMIGWCTLMMRDDNKRDGAFYKSTQSFHKQKATSFVTSSRNVHVELYELKAGHGDGVRTSP